MFPIASGSELASMVRETARSLPDAPSVPEALDELSAEDDFDDAPQSLHNRSPTGGRKTGRAMKCSSPCWRRAVPWLMVLVTIACYPTGQPPDTFLVFDSALPIDGGQVACFRIPSVVQLSSGVLLAFAEGRTISCDDCAMTGIALSRSADGGRTWSPPSWLIAPNESVAGNPTAAWDAVSERVLVQYVRGRAFLGPPHQPCNPALSNWQLTSADGIQWSKPADLSRFLGRWAGSLVGPGSGIQLTAGPWQGRILFAGHWGVYNATQVWYSDDGGVTYWLSKDIFSRFDESQLVELDDGKVQINMRNVLSRHKCNCRGVAVSIDGGVSFGRVRFDDALISPVCQASLARINGHVYFANPQHTWRRANGRIKVSDDDGVTWTEHASLTNGGPRGSFDYSAMVQHALHDDASKGGILWSHNPMPVLPTLGPVPLGRWLVYFTRFELRPRLQPIEPSRGEATVPAESTTQPPMAERLSERPHRVYTERRI